MDTLHYLSIDHAHVVSSYAYLISWNKRKFYIRKEFSPTGIVSVHQHGRREVI